jgi:heat shock protein HslJ
MRAARYHAATAAVVGAALLLALVLVLHGSGAPTTTRLVRFVSFFTVQSNLLVVLTAVLLAAVPDRDGLVWRVVRLDALLGITVTGIVYVTVLSGSQTLEGGDLLADWGLHYVSPVLVVLGWLRFGPRPRLDPSTLARGLLWPAAWLVYTLAHGAATGWYPYPFVDVGTHGYATVVRNAALVLLVAVLVELAFLVGDRRLRAAPSGLPVVGPWRVLSVGGRPVPDGVRTSIELGADGRLTGTTGVNQVGGPYGVEDGVLRAGPLATTRMAGPADAMAVEAGILDALSGPLAVRHAGGGVLVLRGAGDELRLARDEAAATGGS